MSKSRLLAWTDEALPKGYVSLAYLVRLWLMLPCKQEQI